MIIRKGEESDIDDIMSCYDVARQYMRNSGNLTQWVNGYPSRSLVEQDIKDGVSYVGVDDGGHLAMAFAFIIGEDPTYEDNAVMRSASERLGFVRCGRIYCGDGTPRVAYQKYVCR